MHDLICISHLRWGFVWQRPQHLLSRLGHQYRVYFVEEPMTNTGIAAPELKVYPATDWLPVTVLCLHVPAQEDHWIGHNDPQTQPIYEQLLKQYFQSQGVGSPLLWLYTPLARPFVQALSPSLLIYDVMDELAAFKDAPAALKEQDRQLLREADVVFTGGLSMYRARLPHVENIHLLPSGVEIDHFAQAADNHLPQPDDLQNIAAPILGYFGVIDERMDLPLLAHLARTHPDWNIVLIGPVIKIDPADLPRAHNLHYLGMKDYRDLPAYLAQFDVALVPFAINEATRYLSPTKTLEYLAAHKPVISTPIQDIVELFGEYVRIGETPAAYVTQVEEALAEHPTARTIRQAKEDQLLLRHTWDSIAQDMAQIIEASLKEKNRSQRAPDQTALYVSQSPTPVEEGIAVA